MPDRNIGVYADWTEAAEPLHLGTVTARPSGAGEITAFAFSGEALEDPALLRHQLDPRLRAGAGAQYPPQGRRTFGMLADSSPDRWGRMLIERRFARDKRDGRLPQNAHLVESDYLLGVHDAYRSGALRFNHDDGPFQDDRDHAGAPPFVHLRELEAASRVIESDVPDDPRIDHALDVLLAPGASLGGARPKASVVDERGALWIAKFPSIADDIDVGAWEAVVHCLAQRCAVRVAEGASARYTGAGTTFRLRRFDRREDGTRIHFASAMTLTDHVDGDGASNGASYIDIADVLISHGAAADEDLTELWRRIVFNIAVANSDDHLRNHGFILSPDGWRLSPAYDMNPVRDATGLALNIDERDNALDFDLARSVADIFRVSAAQQREIFAEVREALSSWQTVAAKFGIGKAERERMASAFRSPEA